MKRMIAIILLLLVIILVARSTTETRLPTEAIALESMDPAAAGAYLAGDIDIGDGGLLSGQPCPAPCAFGIRIGETQLDQVTSVLASHGVSRCWTEPNLSWSLVSCGGSRLNVQVNMQTRLVNAIWFDPNVPISLGDIIERYGEPNYVTVGQEAPDTIYPRLYWNLIRMLVTLPEIVGATYEVDATTQIETVDFSDEDLYRTAEKDTQPYYRPWHGYGAYQPAEPFPSNLTPIATATP